MASKFNVAALLAALVVTVLVFLATSLGLGEYLEWVSSLTEDQQLALRVLILMAPSVTAIGFIARRHRERQ